MKKIILSIAFFMFIGLIFADNDGAKSSNSSDTPDQTISFTGKVVDINTGETLTGAEVKIEGTDIKTYTDLDGNYLIEDIKPGKYNIIASFISYKKSYVENFIADNKNNRLDIKLQLLK